MEINNGRLSFWVSLLVFSFLIASQFSVYILGMRLSAYRIVLLLAFFPVVNIYFSRIKKLSVDYFVFAVAGLMFVTMLINHGSDKLAYGASQVLETIVPYLMGRVYIQNKANLIAFSDVLFKLILLLLIPVIYESFTGYNLLIHPFGGEIFRSAQGYIRFGLYRAFGPFDHPILLGVFVTAGFALTTISKKNGIAKYLVVLAVSFTSISSAAYLMLAIQIAMLKIQRLAHARLASFAAALIGLYIFINIFSNRTPMAVLSSYLSIDSVTAYYRILINRYAWENVMQHPFIGIGLNDWARPDWMPPSIDNFWMLVAVQYGLITLTCLVITVYLSLKSTYVNYDTSESIGIRVLLISIIVVLITVDIWNVVYVFFWLIIGISNSLGQFKLPTPINELPHKDRLPSVT